MTRSAHDEAVEAMAIALFARKNRETRPEVIARMWGWLTLKSQENYREYARAAITAYLRHMRAAGVVVTRGPEARAGNLFWGREGTADASGWNRCRAATLANAVEVPE